MMPIVLTVDCRMIRHSGIGTYLQNLLEFISRMSDMQLYCIGDKQILKEFSWAGSVHIIPCNAPIFSLREQFELPFKIPVCDIFWSPQYNIPIFPIRAKKRVVTLHDVYHMAFFHTLSTMEKIYAKLMLNAAVLLSDTTITVSEFSQKEILRYLIAPKEKIQVIHNGAKRFPVTRPENPIKKPYILVVGNVKPHKNLANAIKAFKLISEKFSDIMLCFVGEKEKLRTSDTGLVQEIASVQERIIFTGHVDDAMLASYYHGASLLLFPSYYEGFGLPVLEAMQFSIPIAASNAASIPEVGGEAILYFDPFDTDAMADTMRLILSKEYTPSLSAYTHQLDRFSWKQSALKHRELFKGLLHDKSFA